MDTVNLGKPGIIQEGLSSPGSLRRGGRAQGYGLQGGGCAATRDGAACRCVARVATRLAGDKPQVVIDAVFPGVAERGDVFLEAPEGIWIPLPQPVGPAKGAERRFVVDLTDGADLKELQGRSIRMTLVGSAGQSEATFDLVDAN